MWFIDLRFIFSIDAVQSAKRSINKHMSQIGHPCPGAFIENVDPCLEIFQWKVVPMSRDFLQKTNPFLQNIPVCLNIWPPPGIINISWDFQGEYLESFIIDFHGSVELLGER